ncbi:GIY-YIG nuclease family protein [Bradyrhizobium septentrionale]|uniref:GIY-YIG nuclease family protein n=1 Tax=Bradyrhizobium septentrionale TaxID=1404411 RepID=A0ABZ2P1I8_9BRAD
MNIALLTPQPTNRVTFKRSHERFVPDTPGCYVLTTFSGEVLYVGLTDNLRRRMDQHLDNPEKTGETKLGRAVVFHWVATSDTFKVERTWMNIHIQHEGAWPLLNKMYSPTST